MGITWRATILSILFCALAIQGQQASNKQSSNRAADGDDWSELKSSMAKMHMAMMSVETSANCDVDFVRLMLPHHQAAIDMARTELMYGKNPQMRRLAQEIITDQQSEIALMQLWLKQHDPSSPNVSRPKPGERKEP